jgi:GMP synthase (glutamine-hydrolysing)
MSEPRLKTGIWVKAQLKLCDLASIPLVVLRHGDDDAGAVLIKRALCAGQAIVYAQGRTSDGRRGWLMGTGREPVPETAADDYIARQVRRDPDLWILEIEDRTGLYTFDGPLI